MGTCGNTNEEKEIETIATGVKKIAEKLEKACDCKASPLISQPCL